jgi:hypothetical protein
MKTTNLEGFISKGKVARRLNRSLKTVNNWMKRGILPYYKLGHRVSFRWSEVVAHLQANYLRSRRQIWGQAHFPLTKDLSAIPPVQSGVALLPRRKVSHSRRGFESRRH